MQLEYKAGDGSFQDLLQEGWQMCHVRVHKMVQLGSLKATQNAEPNWTPQEPQMVRIGSAFSIHFGHFCVSNIAPNSDRDAAETGAPNHRPTDLASRLRLAGRQVQILVWTKGGPINKYTLMDFATKSTNFHQNKRNEQQPAQSVQEFPQNLLT